MNLATHDTVVNGQMLGRPSTGYHDGIAGLIVHTIDVWRSRVRDRNRLAALDRRDLQDLSLSRWEVESELAKPFWRG